MTTSRRKLVQRLTDVLIRHDIQPDGGLLNELARASKTPAEGVPPAVEAFCGVVLRYPPKYQWDEMDRGVGNTLDAIERWEEVVKAYVMLGWNPSNVTNMLDYFKRGELPTTSKNGKTDEPRRGQVVKNADGSFYV